MPVDHERTLTPKSDNRPRARRSHQTFICSPTLVRNGTYDGCRMIGKVQNSAAPSLPQLGGAWQALKRHKAWAAFTAILLIAAIVGGSFIATRSTAGAAYVTQPVVQQDLTQSVTASGT